MNITEERRAHRREYMKRWRAANLEKARDISRRSRARHIDVRRAEDRNRPRNIDPVKNRERARRYAAKHPERVRAYTKVWAAQHPERTRAYCANRRAMRLAQRCTCCTDEQIQFFYDNAALCPPGQVHVDHIVPLALGGHHCAKNLQAITDVDHAEKTRRDHRAIAEAKRRSRLLRRWPTQESGSPICRSTSRHRPRAPPHGADSWSIHARI